MTDRTEWVDDHFVAGDLALDLANTVFRRRPELGADLFTGTDDLAAWLVRTGVLAGDAADTVTSAQLEEARALRAHLWAVFDAQREGRTIPADDLGGMLDMARLAIGGLAVHPDGSTTAHDPTGALAVVALRGLARALEPPSQGIRACDRCGWFFIDSSRGRRRRWCSMKTCGNQAKASRYRAAHG